MENALVISHEWNLSIEEVRELADSGFQVIPATDGLQAIRHFATRPIAAVIINHQLPDIDVADLIAFFRHHVEELPVVMLSNRMAVSDAPASVDAVIHKHNCSALLATTLQLLSQAQLGSTARTQAA